jgi:type II secretory pathway pseudopilin PulG
LGARVRGLTLLEVVVALLLFAMMATMMLESQSTAVTATYKAELETTMAYLLSFRLSMVQLLPEDYDDQEEGTFPASGKSTRFFDEDKIFADKKRYRGYAWEVVKQETVGAGSDSLVNVDGTELDPLFPEEGGTTASGDSIPIDDVPEKEPKDVDRMILIKVTIYPPGYDATAEPDEVRIPPRSAWTAIPVVPANEEEAGG